MFLILNWKKWCCFNIVLWGVISHNKSSLIKLFAAQHSKVIVLSNNDQVALGHICDLWLKVDIISRKEAYTFRKGDWKHVMIFIKPQICVEQEPCAKVFFCCVFFNTQIQHQIKWSHFYLFMRCAGLALNGWQTINTDWLITMHSRYIAVKYKTILNTLRKEDI